MEWSNILSSLLAVLLAIGLPLALRKRRKGSAQNIEQFLYHLSGIGVKSFLLDKEAEEAKLGRRRVSKQKPEGVIKIEGRNIDYINVISVTTQYGVNFYLDYLAKTSGWLGKRDRKKTRMVKKKSSGMWGKVTDIEWKGDTYLSQELNFDYQLKDRLLQAELDKLKGSIWIYPEVKYEYARIRTTYLLPSTDLFEAIDIIAKYIKSGW